MRFTKMSKVFSNGLRRTWHLLACLAALGRITCLAAASFCCLSAHPKTAGLELDDPATFQLRRADHSIKAFS